MCGASSRRRTPRAARAGGRRGRAVAARRRRRESSVGTRKVAAPADRVTARAACGSATPRAAFSPSRSVPSPRFPYPFPTRATLSLGALQRRSTAQGPAQGPRRDHRGNVARGVCRAAVRGARRAELALKPHVWLSDEWFSPGGVPGSPCRSTSRTRAAPLERNQILDVEGRIARGVHAHHAHETGHAIQHGYQLHRRRKWQELFGKSSTKYPEYYRPNPSSKRTSSTYGSGTRRVTRMKTSPRRSPCGSGRGPTGGRVMRAGPRSGSFATSTR
jgi:hypothetical protein